METKEMAFKGFKMNGFIMLFIHLVILSALIVTCFMQAAKGGQVVEMAYSIAGVLFVLVWLILFAGYMQLEPNEARVMYFLENTRERLRKPVFSGSILF